MIIKVSHRLLTCRFQLLLAACFFVLIPISSAQNWYGCNGCCGYVAGAAGWACCRVRGALYSACFNNTDCTVLNSQCILGCCQCPFPFYRQNACQQCELVPRVLGAQCTSSVQCARDIFRAVCVNGVCQCASAYKSACVNGMCQCVPRCLGDQCASDADCTTNVANSVCSGGTCQCAAGFSPNVCGQCVPGCTFDFSSAQGNWYGCSGCCGYVAGAAGWACCKQRGALYSACFNNSDCSVLNSQCILGCCQCPFPFYRQNACQQCELVPRVLGSQCTSSIQCARDIFRAVCVNGVCQCATPYKSACVNGVCQCVPRCLGDQCAQDGDCSINIANSVCSGGTCQCAAGFAPNVCGQCVPAAPIGTAGVGNIVVGRN